MSIIQGTTKVSAGGYNIDQSIRFNDDDSAKLTRTPASAGNRKTWTWSGWVKRGNLGAHIMFGTGTLSGTANDMVLWFNASDQIAFYRNSVYILRTDPVYRDPSAWYHIVLHIDTTNATATDRQRLWVNGVEVTDFNQDNNLALNGSYAVNNTIQHAIGQTGTYGSNYYDGYMAEINFIDGQALDPTSFGEYDSVSGVWIPKAYAGTYGTNGFYITGADSADLGADYSGNGNDFTSSGLTADDQVTDTPTDNYAVFSDIIKGENSYHASSYGWGSNTISEGGLKVLGPTGTNLAGATISYPSSGKFYYEATYIGTDTAFFGIADLYDDTKAVWYRNNGWVSENSSSWNTSSGAASYTAGDVLAISVNMDGNEAKFYKNNSLQSTVSLTAGSTYTPVLFGGNSSIGFSIDFGQLGFTYTPPTGFSALSTANLPDPTIKDGSAYFQTTLYTGTGSVLEVNQIENSTFQPDLVWIKQRNKIDNHIVNDAVRGADKALYTNSTTAEIINGSVTSFDSDGFTLGTWNNVNQSGITAAAWQWLAANGTASNSDGDFTSTVSANQTSGFSVLTWTGDGTSTVVNSIGHGLGKAPSLIIMRRRSPADDWFVYAEPITQSYYLRLNSTAAQAIDTGNNTWGGTAPTSSVFYTEAIGSAAYDYVAYCFAEVEGFSKIGKYTGNGSADGPFLWCGFRPAFVLVKRTNTADNWVIVDSSRNSYNVANLRIYPDTTNADITSTIYDFLSNGFKLRASDGGVNGSGSTYIFMAFAEHPFGGSTVTPVPAR